MKPELQRRVQRYGWDRASGYYERYWKDQLAPAQERLLRMAGLQAGEQVLDVACGTGIVTLEAARTVGPEGSVTATDISDAMVRMAFRSADQAGLGNVTGVRADAESLPLGDSTFDVALCSLGLMYVVHPVSALREMHRTLVPGGRVSVAVWGERRNCGWAEIFPIVDRRVSSDVCPMFFQLGTSDTLRVAMEEAGFRNIEVCRFQTKLVYADEGEAIGAAFEGGPVALAHSRFDERMRADAHREYLASIAAFRLTNGYAVPGEFVVASAQRTSG
jgi:ubiquinone/menaquinone biosynthesis C-methylase UbiE